MTKKEIKKARNKSVIYVKYIDYINDASDGLYAIKKHDNQWLVGGAILSNKKIVSMYNRIDDVIDTACDCQGFHYWISVILKQRKQNKIKRAKIKVIRSPRYTSKGMLPLRIREKTVRVKRANIATIKEIINK